MSVLDCGESRKAGDREREKSAPLPRLCDCCKAVMPREAKACEQCGTVREAKSGIEARDGELVEIGSGARSTWSPTIAEKVDVIRRAKAHSRRARL